MKENAKKRLKRCTVIRIGDGRVMVGRKGAKRQEEVKGIGRYGSEGNAYGIGRIRKRKVIRKKVRTAG